MATKTYLIGLYLAELALYRYITRWQVNIANAGASEEVIACIASLLAALETCLPLIKPAPPTP